MSFVNGSLTAEQRDASRIAGIGYLAIIVFGILGEFFIRSNLIESGDPRATAANILDAEWLFRISVASDLVMLIFDAIVAFALFVLLRPVNQTVAIVAAGFRLIHTAVYGATLLTLMFVVELLGADYLAAFGRDGVESLALLFLEGHAYGYVLGLVFFGVHVLILAWLFARSGYVPRLLSALLVLAGAGYLVDSFANVLMTNYDDYATAFALVVFVPAFIAELSLAVWLLVAGTAARKTTGAPALGARPVQG
jgi:hypothetical protein